MFECLHVFELYKEIEQFLRHRGSGIAGYFENEEFVVSVAYLPDILSHPNDLNTSIRVTTMYMITYMAHAVAFAAIRTTKTREHFAESSYTTQLRVQTMHNTRIVLLFNNLLT